MTENSRRVFNFLKENYGKNFTAQEIAAALDVSVNAVTGSVNGLCRDTKHPAYAMRTETQVEGADGKVATVKYISLTEEGLAFDPDAAEAKE